MFTSEQAETEISRKIKLWLFSPDLGNFDDSRSQVGFFFAMNSHFRNDAPFTSLQIYIMSQWCHFGWNTVPCDVFFTSQSRYSWLRLCIHAHLCTEVAAIDPQTAIIKNWLSFSLSSSYKNPISTVHLHLSPWMRRKREGSPGSSIISSGKELCF